MKSFFRVIGWILVTLISFAYVNTEVYNFSPTYPFSGKKIYNPYSDGISTLRKSNFHAHSKSWGGFTNGADPIDSVVDHYLKVGYDLVGLSNYHKISKGKYARDNIYVPIYEHGLNIEKAHYLAINTKKVSYFDVPLFHTNHTKQFVLNQLTQFADIICVAHPGIRNGHSPTSLQKLSNYSHLELINGSKIASIHWDSVLSAGKPIWTLSNDDIHNLKEKKFAQSWTAVIAPEKSSESIINALKSGSSFAVIENNLIRNKHTFALPIPSKITIDESVLHIKFQDVVDSVVLIGQSGKVKLRLTNVKDVYYSIAGDDTYIRGEFRNSGATVYSNPIFRWNQLADLKNNSSASVNFWGTLSFRILVLLLWFSITIFLYPKIVYSIFSTWNSIRLILNQGILDFEAVK
jgi:hypothetical protein